MLKNLLREPLLHFLLIGAALFLVYNLQNDDVDTDDSNQIVISEAHIDRFIVMWEKRRQRPPTQFELDGLIERQIRDEVLYREALKLGMDKHDSLVRRRLAQKMEFLFADIADQEEPTEAQLQEFLNANPEKFEIPGRISFVHIYFNGDKRGSQTRADASKLLAEIKKSGAVEDFEQLGDSFLLGQRHANLTPTEIKNLLGEEFTQQLIAFPTGSWQGPVASSYGFHLVTIENSTPSLEPALDAVRDKVRTEWEAVQRQKMDDIFYQNLRQQYEIVIENTAQTRTQ